MTRIGTLERELMSMRQVLDQTLVQGHGNVARSWRVARTHDGGGTYPTTGQQFNVELIDLGFPEVVGDQAQMIVPRTDYYPICRNLVGTIPPEGTLILVFEIDQKWYTNFGGSGNTILRGTAVDPIPAGSIGTIENLVELQGAWDTVANPQITATLPTVAFEITQEAVDAGAAVWVIQKPDGMWEIFNAECVKDETGWGAVGLSTPEADTDIGAGWNPVDQPNQTEVALRNVTYDTATGNFSFQKKGIWDLGLLLNFQHNESNAGRQTALRLWDATGGSQLGDSFPIAIARNQPSTQVSITYPSEIPTVALGNLLRFEIGGFDTLTNIIWTQSELQFSKKSGSGDFVT